MSFWVGLGVGVVAALLAQTCVAWLIPAPWLDLFLAFALAVSLLGAPADARIAGWLIGLAQDLTSLDAFGIHALVLGIAALLVTQLREWWPVDLLAGRFLLLVACGLTSQIVYVAHAWFWSARPGETLAELVVSALLAALAAAALAAWGVGAVSSRARARGRGRRSAARRSATF